MAIEATLGIISAGGGIVWASWTKGIKPYIRNQKKKVRERDEKLTEIRDELRYNGGSSLKDMVFKISKKTDAIETRLDSIEENQKLSMNLQGIAFWISDEYGNCTYASPALCKVMGRSEQEIMGSNWMGWIHHDDKERVVEAWRFSIEHKAPFDEIYSYKKADGKYQKVWGTAFPRASKNNAIGGLLGKLVAVEEPTKN